MGAKKLNVEMFNHERKMEFINGVESNKDRVTSILRAMKPYEEKAGKDLSEMSYEDLQNAVSSAYGVRAATYRVVRYVLYKYIKWCDEQGYPVSDAISELKNENYEKIRNEMVASPHHLAVLLDQVFDPLELSTNDCLYRCFLWMAFSGLKAIDAIDITIDEIDFDAMLIRHAGKDYEIYGKSVPTLKIGVYATQFRYIHPGYPDREIYLDRKDNRYLLRSIRSDRLSMNSTNAHISLKCKEAGVSLTYKNIMMSGMFFRLFEQEQIGVKIDFKSIARELISADEYKGSAKKKSRQVYLSYSESAFKKDYENWKKAFNLQ